MGGKLYGACWHLFLILADFCGVSRLDLCLRCPALGLALLLLPIAKNGAVNTRVQACVRSRAPLFLNPPCTQSCRVTQRSCAERAHLLSKVEAPSGSMFPSVALGGSNLYKSLSF